jgi:hypothetical protein
MVVPLLLMSIQAASAFAGGALPEFDFSLTSVAAQWKAVLDIGAARNTPDGLELTLNGPDPQLHGPARDFPPAAELRLLVRLMSGQGGEAQVFFFRDRPSEVDSIRFFVKPGEWTDATLRVPPLGAGYRLRIDPPGSGGKFIIASLRFEFVDGTEPLAWPRPVALDLASAVRLTNRAVELQVVEEGFAVAVDGRRVATSHTRPRLGYLAGDKLEWLECRPVDASRVRVDHTQGVVTRVFSLADRHGATWRVAQRFTTGASPDVIDVEVEVETDRDRHVMFLPLLLLVASEGASQIDQGLLAGLEYLEGEPSSSEADLVGPESRRQVPANYKITFPLMALQKDGAYIGLIWDHAPRFSALFDTPDRLLSTGGHVMGVLFPGSGGSDRIEGSLLPKRPQTLRAGEKLVVRAHIVAGNGTSVVPAIRQYVRLRGLPPVPDTGYSFEQYAALAATGWLDSRIREADLYRHAVDARFKPQPAADAAVFMHWLATQTSDPLVAQRLAEAARGAMSVVPPAEFNRAAVAHVRFPLPALLFGNVTENAEAARVQALGLRGRFAADGSVPYARGSGGRGLDRTHWAKDANGLTAEVVESFLEAAAFSGDPALIAEAIARVRDMKKFRDTVPRGAQTWEIPLHTPDILAAARLVRAYTLGFELSGDAELLEQAISWAWTGVPFVYLVHPVGVKHRPYGTIAVLGATHWTGTVWIGRPVPWCGLVYADALYRLLKHDPTGPWKQLADGITSTAIAYSWPHLERGYQGLLPDFWDLPLGRRGAPAINPGTVQANAARLYGKPALFDFHVVRRNAPGTLADAPVTIYAPGEVVQQPAAPGRLVFTVNGWTREPYYVLLNGVTRMPKLLIDGHSTPITDPHLFQEHMGRLVLSLSGRATVELVQTD